MNILHKHPTDHLLDIVECPNCGKNATYGQMLMICGYSGCPKCYENDLFPRVMKLRETDYDRYVKGPVYRLDIKKAKEKYDVVS